MISALLPMDTKLEMPMPRGRSLCRLLPESERPALDANAQGTTHRRGSGPKRRIQAGWRIRVESAEDSWDQRVACSNCRANAKIQGELVSSRPSLTNLIKARC